MRAVAFALIALLSIAGLSGPIATADTQSPTATYAGSTESGFITMNAAPATNYCVRFRAADGTWPILSSGAIPASGTKTVAVAVAPPPGGYTTYGVQFFSPGEPVTFVTLIADEDGWLWD